MRRTPVLLLVTAVVFGLGLSVLNTATPEAFADIRNHLSMVNFVGVNDPSVSSDVEKGGGGPTVAIGFVGQPFKARIEYQIGWGHAPEDGGSFVYEASDIQNPKYKILCDVGDSACNKGLSIAGLHFDPSTGVVEGVPMDAGAYYFYPAVRDTAPDWQPYRGNGYWWTEFNTVDGETWITSLYRTGIIILPAPTDKLVKLTCSFAGNSGFNPDGFAVTLDFDSAYAEVSVGGKLAGVYKITTGDVVGWSLMPFSVKGFGGASSISIDRGTGAITVTYSSDSNTPTKTGTCVKRPATNLF